MPTGDVCIAWGGLDGRLIHLDCPVIVADEDAAARCPAKPEPPFPKVCPCECSTCKRAWFAAGWPVVRDGVVVTRSDR